jgi:hypothetical protein
VSADRTVHAETPYARIVRYGRAGSWRIEDVGPIRVHWGARRSLRDIVEYITEQPQNEVTYHFGRPGGLQFDKRVRDELARVGSDT